ncbi:MAG: DUF1049 domain-containing protein [Rhodomicrobium sp.]
MKRFIKVLLLCVLGGVVAAFAVANREPVKFVLDPLSPFSDRNLVPSIEAPFFVYLFIAMFIGIFLGAAAVWLGQGHWRKAARARSKEAAIWKREAETLKAGLQASPGTSITPATQRPLRSYL